MSAKPAGPNPYRGEASLIVGGQTLVLRPSFAALIAAEEELGSLFEIVERAAEGVLKLSQIVALFDHLSSGRAEAISRARIGEAVVEKGLAGVTPILKMILTQILQGR
ncbi:MAG: gene transfer agent family protein [Sphingomicrobium sp.]